jgi:hypothetical protein
VRALVRPDERSRSAAIGGRAVVSAQGFIILNRSSPRNADRLSHVDQHNKHDGLSKRQGTAGSDWKGPIDSLKRIFSHADASRYQEGRGRFRMATIRASCPTCGDVELTTADVRVRVCLNDNHGDYRFRCPLCHFTVVKGAEPRTIDLLVASGVAMDTWTLPAELGEQHRGAPISHDDLLDFHVLLSDEVLLEEAMQALLNR